MPQQQEKKQPAPLGAATRYVLASNTLWLVGRGEGCQPRLPTDLCHSDVSRYHCLIGKDASGLWIKDLGSRNGTFVNGKRIDGGRREVSRTALPDMPHPIHDGAEILLGKHTILHLRVLGPDVLELVDDTVVHVDKRE